MTTFLLVRHADHEWLGRGLAGRLPDVSLSGRGREQAQAFARRMDPVAIDAVYSSPQPRARETVAALAGRRSLNVDVLDAFDEIDFGAWTGQTFEQLAAHPHWETWVHRRSIARPPGGEKFAEVQQRVLSGMEQLSRRHAHQTVLVASHGDVIKALLASCLGMSLDHLERLEIAPVSLSIVAAAGDWRQVRLVNGREPPLQPA